MYVDTRSYRPGYAVPAKQGARKLNGDERAAIAKAYYAGCTPGELSSQYGIAPAHVSMIARRYDEDQYRAKRRAYEKRAIAKSPAIELPVPEPEPEPEQIEPSPHHVVTINGMAISLPEISIQAGDLE